MYTSFLSTITLAGAFAEATRSAQARDTRQANRTRADRRAPSAPSLAARLGSRFAQAGGVGLVELQQDGRCQAG